MTQAWQCEVCEGINQGGTTCATCGAVLPPGATPSPAPTVASIPLPPRPAPAVPPNPRTRERPSRPAPRPRAERPGTLPRSPAAPPATRPRPAPRTAATPWPAPAGGVAAPGAPRRRPSGLVALLARLVLLLGWLLSASYAPGLAPRTIEGAATGDGIAVRTDGEDTLVLVPDDTAGGDLPIRVEFTDAGTAFDVRRRSQTVWVVSREGLPALTTIAGRAGDERVLRVPGRPPAESWTAQVAGERVPAEGTRAVEVVAPPLPAPAGDPRLAVAGGVLAALAAWRAAATATGATLRRDARAVLFGLLLLAGAPVAARLLQRAAAATGWSVPFPTAEPALVWVAMTAIVPLLALRLSALAAGTRAPSADARPLRGWARGAAGLAGFGLLVLAALLGQAVVLRYLPGLSV